MVWRIFTFWGKKSLFFAKSFQKLSHFFYFIHFQFCCNLLNNCFIFIWWSQKFSFLFDSNRVFFSNFWQKNIGKSTSKLVPKTYSKMEKKLSIIWKSQSGCRSNYRHPRWGAQHISQIGQPDSKKLSIVEDYEKWSRKSFPKMNHPWN